MPLADLLLDKCCTSMHREIVGFTDNSIAKIESYDWPGVIFGS